VKAKLEESLIKTVNASKSKMKANLESSETKNCECVQNQSESKSGIIQDASKNKEKTNLESSQIKNCECVQKQNEGKSGIIPD
jgi:rRNA-processing protein FCF1